MDVRKLPETNKCKGESKSEKQWSKGEGEVVRGPKNHVLLKSGTVVWCGVCGAFSETRSDRLRVACLGHPPQQHGAGGVRSQLVRMRAGLHPVTKMKLPQTTWMDGRPVNTHSYARRQGRVEVDDQFIPYEVKPGECTKPRCDNGGKSAEVKMRLLRGRIKGKELKAAREDRKRRKERRRHEVEMLISSFRDAEDTENESLLPGDPVAEESVNDQDEAELWSTMVADARCDRPDRFKAMQCKPSRLSRLAVKSKAHG